MNRGQERGNHREARGRHWEQLAESFLNRRGLKTLERNFNCRMGEIDLVKLGPQRLRCELSTKYPCPAITLHARSLIFAKNFQIFDYSDCSTASSPIV
jgi:hypothetical protein